VAPSDSPNKGIMHLRPFKPATALGLLVVIPTLALISYVLAGSTAPLSPTLIVWVLMVAVVELLPVSTWAGVQVSLGFTLLTAVAIIFAPPLAGLVAFLGECDPREYRREVSLVQALFNRSQVALAVMASSEVFHHLSSVSHPLTKMIPAALVATVVDYVINISLVTTAVALGYGDPPSRVLRELLGRGQEFLISYAGLGVLGTVLAKLYHYPGVGMWSVVTVFAPLLFARQMFYRTRALQEAHQELQEREQVLRSLSNVMAEERADERTQIAAYLHDDLAQILFRLSIQVDVARKLLEKGEIPEVMEQLEKIRESKQDTSDRVRALIRDLHRSPLGAKGLAEALESFTDEVGRDSGVSFHRDIADIDLPAPIALLVYHIAREGLMNALKHAQASDMWIAVRESGDFIELQLRDNGVGFDSTAPGPEGHFGMAMMRERAQVGGGTFEMTSAPGAGATITVRFPIALLQETPTPTAPTSPASGAAAATPAGDASPDTSGTSEPEADGSRQTAPA
jgi:signal transduction histidine kinase